VGAVQAHARVEVVRAVPPSVFWPKPNVDSAIVSVVPEAERRRQVGDYARFAELVRAAFAHRRKTLANALAASHAFGDEAGIGGALAACGIDPRARAEQVSREQYVRLANALGGSAGGTG
jgi:16S rRNA (adenine1518-N6/adenine1519-N6)-dimethyltransferase